MQKAVQINNPHNYNYSKTKLTVNQQKTNILYTKST